MGYDKPSNMVVLCYKEMASELFFPELFSLALEVCVCVL